VALQWNSSDKESTVSSQKHQNPRGQAPIPGSARHWTRTINAIARQPGPLKETGEPLRRGLARGLTGGLVKLADPQFEGQTKGQLGNPPIEGHW